MTKHASVADKNVCNSEPKVRCLISSYIVFWLQIERNQDAYERRLGTVYEGEVFKLRDKSLNISANYFSVLSFLF